MHIQSGPNEGNATIFSIDSMSTESLGLDGTSIATQEGAQQALTSIDSAINQVSLQRGSLGALENRFTSTLSSLGIAAENQLAAQSRIQDADMALEMMRLTQQNIRSQSSMAMMAQGMKMDQQNIMSLLK
jgi:flagellin